MAEQMTAAERLALVARIERISDTRRWAWFNIGAMMCATDTGVVHGPEMAPC